MGREKSRSSLGRARRPNLEKNVAGLGPRRPKKRAPGWGVGAAPGLRLRPSRGLRGPGGSAGAGPEKDSLGLLVPVWLRGRGAPLGDLGPLGRALPIASLARTSAWHGNLLPERRALLFCFVFNLSKRHRRSERLRGLAVATARARGRAGFEPCSVCP